MRPLAIALTVLALAAGSGASRAEPPPAATLASKVGAWVYAAELRPLDVDLDEGERLTTATDARLAAINIEVGPLVARAHALGSELTVTREALEAARDERRTRPGDNDDRARVLDRKIAAAEGRIEEIERHRERVYARMDRLSREANLLMEGGLRMSSAAADIAEQPKATAARKRKATALLHHTEQLHRARMALIKTMMKPSE